MLAGLVPSKAVREDLFCGSLLTSGAFPEILGVPWLTDVRP